MNPRIKSDLGQAGDTSNNCAQTGVIHWQIFNTEDSAVLKSGQIAIVVPLTPMACRRTVRSQMMHEISNYLSENGILEDDGSLPAFSGKTGGGGGGAVSSVFGRTGAVIAAANDYGWTDISGKPSTFPPDAHSHAESDVTNLVTDLAGKQATLGFTAENSANKGAASGYASLDAGTKIPIAQVPTGSTSSTVCIGNDARLSDARTPLSHTHAAADVNSGTLGTARLGSGTADSTTFLRGDSTWAAPGGGGGVAFREFTLCSGGCVTFTNLGAGPTEMGSQASRSHADLSTFTDARVVTNWSAAAVSGDFQIECADTTGFSPVTDLLQWDNPVANTLILGAWTTIPAGCKTSGGVYVRAVGINGNGTEDPAARFIKFQVR